MEPRVPYMLKHSYRRSHIFITNLLVFVMLYWGTLELCSVVTAQRSLWAAGPQWTVAQTMDRPPQLETMALHDNCGRVLSPHSALASV